MVIICFSDSSCLCEIIILYVLLGLGWRMVIYCVSFLDNFKVSWDLRWKICFEGGIGIYRLICISNKFVLGILLV